MFPRWQHKTQRSFAILSLMENTWSWVWSCGTKAAVPHFFLLTREMVWNWLCSQQPYNRAVFQKTPRYLYTKAVLRWKDGQMWTGEQVKPCGNGSGEIGFSTVGKQITLVPWELVSKRPSHSSFPITAASYGLASMVKERERACYHCEKALALPKGRWS